MIHDAIPDGDLAKIAKEVLKHKNLAKNKEKIKEIEEKGKVRRFQIGRASCRERV